MIAVASVWALSVLVGAADVPRALGVELPRAVLAATASETALASARRFAEQLRFEEAMVDYQRYLTDSQRPARERARAMLELAFIHLVLGDDVNAQRHAAGALELDPELTLPKDAPPKQVSFLASMRKQLQTRARLEVLARAAAEAPQEVRVKVTDPEKKIRRVLLRHSIAQTGPFYGSTMRCAKDACVGEIPAPPGANAFTAWYYVEGEDAAGNTVALGASASAPLQLAVVQRTPWYRSPYVWGGGAAVLIGAAAVFYIASAR